MDLSEIILKIVYLEFIPPKTLLILKIIFSSVSFLFLVLLVYFLRKSSWLKLRYGVDLEDFLQAKIFREEKYEQIWFKIKKRLKKRSDSEWKLALIEADSFLNKILEKMGYEGESLGERLKKIDENFLSNLQEVWQAHKLRNNIIHDPDFKITKEEAERAFQIYEDSLRQLNILT
jgi:hypothetical protein